MIFFYWRKISSSYITVSLFKVWLLLSSWVVLEYNFEFVILSILNLYLCSFNRSFQWMFFNSIKEIKTFRKEINKFLSKVMSNIYSKVATEKKLTFSKKIYHQVSFCHQLQLTQISLNFKTSCCNLKIRNLVAKLYVAFLLF